MSNRVVNLIPAAKPQPKPMPRRPESPAEDVSFERTLKKATPKPKPAEAKERSELKESDRTDVTQSTSKKKVEKREETPVEETDGSSNESVADGLEKAEKTSAEPNDEIITIAAASAVNTTFAESSPTDEIEGQDATADSANKDLGSAKAATTVRELKTEIDSSDRAVDPTEAGNVEEVDGESMTDELETPHGEIEFSDELFDEEPHLSKSAAAATSSAKSAMKSDTQTPVDSSLESAADNETDTIAADGEADAETQQQAFDDHSAAIRDDAAKGLDKASEASAGDIEPFADLLSKAGANETSRIQQVRPVQPAIVPERIFAETNHSQIISSVKQELLPHGGTMQLRLDPPQLGALQITVEMRDGVMTAAFQTSNDEATRLLSHSLHQLKQSLESQGVSVDRMHVQQAPRDQEMAGNEDGQQRQQSPAEQHSARQEQQRREMMQRLWRKLSGTDDFLDLVA